MRVCGLMWCLIFPFGSALAADRPNVVVIMADDMGWSDIGCYGGEVETPNLDRLARSGIRFTQFYNTGRCCPTRASLLTGLYPHQAGVGHMMSDRGHDGYRGDLNRRCRTIAEVLRPAGYRTYMSGKWHVAKQTSVDGSKQNWPLQRGFDRFYGTITGAGSFYDPSTLTDGNTRIAAPKSDFYYTDVISDRAAGFIQDHRGTNSDQPFFLYVAYTAPHWPLHALEEDIDRYRGRYDAGWDTLRSERYARLKKMNLIEASWRLSPLDRGIPDWDKLPDRDWFTRRMEVYAAMIDRMDQGIGKIVRALEGAGQLENTLIMFLADNGGCAEEIGSLGEVRLANPNAKQKTPPAPGEAQSSIFPRWTRDGKPVRTGRGLMPGPADTYQAYGKGWANASNTPFRLYKHYVHEGGISTPLIVHWPAGVERRGAIDHQPGHLIDIMATCVDVARADYPAEVGGQTITALEGRSLRPVFAGESIDREALYWEHEGNRAVRRGAWKLVARGARGPWELYNLNRDRTELNDLASAEPERVQALSQLWQAWAERAHVLPLDPQRPDDLSRFNLSKAFDLSRGQKLDRYRAPYLKGKSFSVEARIDATPSTRGVIVAQGGASHGWSLYLDLNDGRQELVFAFRRAGRLTLARAAIASAVLAREPIHASVSDKGVLAIVVAGTVVARSEARGPLTEQPVDGLEVGRDDGGAVSGYRAPFVYDGTIKSLRIEVESDLPSPKPEAGRNRHR